MLDGAVAYYAAGSAVVVLDVPIRPYRGNPPAPTARDDWEIGVDW